MYAFRLNEKKLLPHLVKGTDYFVAHSVGLLVAIKPVMEGYVHWYILPKFSNKISVFQVVGASTSHSILHSGSVSSSHDWRKR